MNILVPDIWLRKFLNTQATPTEIREYLSLCGPSVERIHGDGKDTVYDIEITGNRPDAMSVAGIAREAAAILPRFGKKATITADPYRSKASVNASTSPLPLTLKTDSALNPRWMSVVFDRVTVSQSPAWLQRLLTLSGLRSINTVVDITNYLMRAYGQPAHVFDYDSIAGHTMTLRASKKGEKLVTLDGKVHTLPGDDIVIADGTGKLIDLCGIMGGENSSVTEKTTRVMLFLQTYDPSHIRKTSMALGHRTEAAALFEKGLDTELVKPAFAAGVAMMAELTGGRIASRVIDIYPKPYSPRVVKASLSKIRSYIGDIATGDLKDYLSSLGFSVKLQKNDITVTVPSFRRDVAIDVDVIEEIARIHGYHEIPSTLPDHSPPETLPDRYLSAEEEIRIRLRDWGYTELSTYSMISREQMDAWGHEPEKAYKIANPLSLEWVYMRPALEPGVFSAVKQNINTSPSLRVFELGKIYEYRTNDLPRERSCLVVAWTGHRFREAKGLAEALFDVLGVPFPEGIRGSDTSAFAWNDKRRLALGEFGSVSEINQDFLSDLGIPVPITLLDLSLERLIRYANPVRTFVPIPSHPSVMEDLSFIVPDRFEIGPLIAKLKTAHPLVSDVTLLDVHKNARTVHIRYQDPKRNLTGEMVTPVRNTLIEIAVKKFGLTLKA